LKASKRKENQIIQFQYKSKEGLLDHALMQNISKRSNSRDKEYNNKLNKSSASYQHDEQRKRIAQLKVAHDSKIIDIPLSPKCLHNSKKPISISKKKELYSSSKAPAVGTYNISYEYVYGKNNLCK
jgi:hypothetical protein